MATTGRAANLMVRLFERCCWNSNLILCRNYAVKRSGKGGGGVAMLERKKLPVETDAEKLVNYVCGSNIYKEGEDVKLKDDSEYPEWLWTLKIDGPVTLEDLEPNTLKYWRAIRRINKRRQNARNKLKPF